MMYVEDIGNSQYKITLTREDEIKLRILIMNYDDIFIRDIACLINFVLLYMTEHAPETMLEPINPLAINLLKDSNNGHSDPA